MFFCEPCRKENQWPESIAMSHGECEICGNVADCNDVPSSVLTRWPAIEQFLADPWEAQSRIRRFAAGSAATSAALEGRQLPEGYVRSDAVQQFLDQREPS